MANPFLSTNGAVEQSATDHCHVVWVKLREVTKEKAPSLFQTMGFDDYRPLHRIGETVTRDGNWWQIHLQSGSSAERHRVQELEQDPHVLYTFKFG